MTGGRSGALAEASKLGAFLRRDLLVRLSYRGAIISDWINLFAQALVFSFVSKLVHPIHLNGGGRTTYIAYVTVGIAVAGFMAVGLARLVSAIQQEQSLGTLESLMVTPTTASVILLGSVVYDLIYVPFRTVIFLIIVSIVFDVSFAASGLRPGAADPGRVHPVRVGHRVDRLGRRAHLPARLGSDRVPAPSR